MSCCQPQSRREFLTTKLTNFRNYLETYCTTDELKARLTEFKDLDSVMPFLLQAVALKHVGQLEATVDTLCDAFPVASDDRGAFRKKIGRYMDMFVDVLTS